MKPFDSLPFRLYSLVACTLHRYIGGVSRVTTVTLPEDLHRILVRRGKQRGESMAAIIRRALDRELGGTEGPTPPSRARRKTPPADVVQWLRAPPGAFCPLFRDASVEPADWDADGDDSGLDAD